MLILNPDGAVKSYQQMSNTKGGFTGILDSDDNFGRSVAALGDHDGDGVGETQVADVYDNHPRARPLSNSNAWESNSTPSSVWVMGYVD